MELIDVMHQQNRYIISHTADYDPQFWIQPEIASSYFQECISSGSERKSGGIVIKRQDSSLEEKEGF